MPLYDLPHDQLVSYQPTMPRPAQLEAFWQETLSNSAGFSLDAHFEAVDCQLAGVRVWDVSYAGYQGQRIKAWFLAPAAAMMASLPTVRQGQVPCVVEYLGYGGGRGLPHQWLFWPSAGFATFIMDTRGQGSVWQNGDTPDLEPVGSNPQAPGFMTRGILDPATYYYRRVFTDAVRAVEATLGHELVDADRIFLAGGSQGGGITLAAASLLGRFPLLRPDGKNLLLAGIMPDVPFLCHFRRASEITASDPYRELVVFAKNQRQHMERMFDTLSWFDCVNLVTWANAPALFSVALMDDICPPSTVYAAFNHYGAAHPPHKEIRVWPYNGHEGGQQFQTQEKLLFALGLAR